MWKCGALRTEIGVTPYERYLNPRCGYVKYNNAIYWVDATTVNVCPLAKDSRAKAAVTILITERARQVYRITTDCGKALMTAPATRFRG